MDRNGLRGNIADKEHVLHGAIHSKPKELAGKIPGSLEFHYSEVAAPEYTGPYEVIPKVEAQTLDTAGKLMRKDVEVYAVPYFEVSNTTGGSTVYIAKSTNA